MRRILVADSSSIIQFVLERMLGKQGYQILYVRHSRDLITGIKSINPDLLFMEAELSRTRGEQICEWLQRQPETRHIPIILTTRLADPEKHAMHEWPGVVSLLRKPLKSDKVLAAVSKIPFVNTVDLLEQQIRSDAG